MKLSKSQIGNISMILIISLVLFTPVGFHIKVFVNKIFASDAAVVPPNEQQTLVQYQWKLVDLEGNKFDFQSNKDKVVLLNFWATWCPPCIAELPSLVELYRDYKEKITFAFIAVDEKDKVAAFLEKKEYQLPVYFEASETPAQLEYKSIPITFIINKNGKIVVAEKGVADWNSINTRNLLDKLLSE